MAHARRARQTTIPELDPPNDITRLQRCVDTAGVPNDLSQRSMPPFNTGVLIGHRGEPEVHHEAASVV